MADLGRAALVTAFLLLVYALVAGSVAAWQKRRRLAESAQNALLAAFGATLVASAVLLAALARHDFSFQYVADHTSHELPLGYTLTAFWGGQEGSLLLWLLVLTGYSVAAVLTGRRAGREVLAWVVPTLGLVGTFFAMLLVFVASPFATQAAAADGAGLNPSLQNPYMAIHPPMLYLGYVGLTVPFAFAMGALLARRTDERWIVATRRWTLAAWAFLGVGQLLGAHWAYVEIGWGGFYAWDPVENAALMPWLAATAFLHSVMIQEKRGMLKVWNVLLVVLAFCLSIFGTFLTRSGIIQSIHSFTQSSIGPWFLGFICLITAGSLALIFIRLPLLRSKTRLESLVSREATFLYNNLLLVALALTILWGVVYPILSEAVTGQAATVSKPYYNFFLHAFGLPLLLLMGIGPLVAWRRASLRALGRTFLWPLGAGRHRGHRPSRGGRGLVPHRRDRLHVLGVRARVDRARVRARHGCAKGARRRRLGRCLLVAHCPEPAALRRLRRSRLDRAARNRRHGRERLPDRSRGSVEAGPVDVGGRRPPRFPRLRDEDGVEPPRNPGARRRLPRETTTSGATSPARTSTSRRTRSRTRSRSVTTGSPAATSS